MKSIIYMPDVAESPLLPPQIASIGRPELQTPISNCLVRNDAASLSKQVFDGYCQVSVRRASRYSGS